MANTYMRANGTYCVRVSNGRKNGKQALVSATYHPLPGATAAQTKKGLQEFAALFEAAVHSGKYRPGVDVGKCLCSDITVAEYASIYLNKIKSRLSPNTFPMYEAVVNDLICESFGNIRLKDINSRHLQAMIDYLSSGGSRADEANSKPLNPATIKRYATVFSSLMEAAFEDGYAEKDALHDRPVHYPRIDPKIIIPYSVDEVKHFLRVLDQEDSIIKAFFYLAVFSGMRRCEILALTWDDIDFDSQLISVNKAAYKEKGFPARTKAPKSCAGVRTIPLQREVMGILDELRNEQSKMQFENPNGYLFVTANGTIWNEDSASKYIYKIEEKADLRRLHLHGLRHTFSSIMVDNGANIVDAKELMGHTEQSTTLRYSHSNCSKKRVLSDRFGDKLLGGIT